MEVGRQIVELAPGQSTELSVNVIAGDWGVYEVKINGLSGWIQVTTKPDEGFVGGVVKQSGGSGIGGARVTIGGQSVLTAPNGYYLLAVPSGAYTLAVSCEGFYDYSASINVNAGASNPQPTIYLVPIPGDTTVSQVKLSQPHSGHPYYQWLVDNLLQWGWKTIYPSGSVILGGESGAPSAVGCTSTIMAYVVKRSKYWRAVLQITRPGGAKDSLSGSKATDNISFVYNWSLAGTYYGKITVESSENNLDWEVTHEINFTLCTVY